MRSTSTRTSLLAVMVAALTLAPAAGALAATGGVESAPPVTAAPRISHRASLATWFGPGFYGQRTACGQVLTPAVVGVAHRSLPCGTLVKMSYHGRQLIVPVIDRGPYAHNGAAWDLTGGAGCTGAPCSRSVLPPRARSCSSRRVAALRGAPRAACVRSRASQRSSTITAPPPAPPATWIASGSTFSGARRRGSDPASSDR